MQDLKFIRPGLFHFNGPYVVSSVLINSIVILDDTDSIRIKWFTCETMRTRDDDSKACFAVFLDRL